ncbi:MAG: hypothetical protein U5O39_04815 [Gammaproteobacteria bacterium]|nr:hypothetical protein [Gammaproteobacteria bacterium]
MAPSRVSPGLGSVLGPAVTGLTVQDHGTETTTLFGALMLIPSSGDARRA